MMHDRSRLYYYIYEIRCYIVAYICIGVLVYMTYVVVGLQY